MKPSDRMLIEQIKAALNTQEDGAALIDVVRDAHRAEQELAAFKRRVRAHDNEDGTSLTALLAAYKRLS